MKRETWARARAEERVPMRRVRGVGGVVDWGGALVVDGGAAIVSVGMVEWEGWCAVIGNMRKSQRVMFVVGVTKSNAGDKTISIRAFLAKCPTNARYRLESPRATQIRKSSIVSATHVSGIYCT